MAAVAEIVQPSGVAPLCAHDPSLAQALGIARDRGETIRSILGAPPESEIASARGRLWCDMVKKPL